MTTPQLNRRIRRYFADCQESGLPVTPAGLALALDMRTGDLASTALPGDQKQAIERALQRIEANTMELALSKAAAKGVEVVLQHTDTPALTDETAYLSDDELNIRLRHLKKRLTKTIRG